MERDSLVCIVTLLEFGLKTLQVSHWPLLVNPFGNGILKILPAFYKLSMKCVVTWYITGIWIKYCSYVRAFLQYRQESIKKAFLIVYFY